MYMCIRTIKDMMSTSTTAVVITYLIRWVRTVQMKKRKSVDRLFSHARDITTSQR